MNSIICQLKLFKGVFVWDYGKKELKEYVLSVVL